MQQLKKWCPEIKQIDYVTLKNAIIKEDKINSAETIQTYNKIY